MINKILVLTIICISLVLILIVEVYNFIIGQEDLDQEIPKQNNTPSYMKNGEWKGVVFRNDIEGVILNGN